MTKVPRADPINADSINGLISAHVILLFFSIKNVAVAVPILPCNLLVPRAAKGGMPDKINAGRDINPPPPANVSSNPAITATKNSNTNNSIEKFTTSNI